MGICSINELIEIYGKDIYSFCRRITYSEFDAEELYQDTFLKAVEVHNRIDKNNNPKSFLLSVAVSLWKNKQRKFARRERIAPTNSIDAEDNITEPSHSETPEAVMLKNELEQKVNHAVSELDEKFRIPVVLYYSSQMSIDEIAEVIKCPKGTVKSRLFKAREILKEKLEVYTID